jgi:hypothetical protein
MRRLSFQFVTVLLGCSACMLATACTDYVSDYEAAVYDRTPVYCYRSLADVECQSTPRSRDRGRLVNYFGPAPIRYPPPEKSDIRLDPPPPIFWFSRDPDPVLTRPWVLDGLDISGTAREPATSPESVDPEEEQKQVFPAPAEI